MPHTLEGNRPDGEDQADTLFIPEGGIQIPEDGTQIPEDDSQKILSPNRNTRGQDAIHIEDSDASHGFLNLATDRTFVEALQTLID